MSRSVTVLRLGHRPQRDMRVTTHVALVARAFGADTVVLPENDAKLVNTIGKVTQQFGGSFTVSIVKNWRSFITKWRETGKAVHLTMYGEHIDDAMPKIKSDDEDILVIVGAEKVPREVYDLADYNVAVGNQPHSEIAALSVFLDRFYEGEGLQRIFDGEMLIEPNPRGKTVRIKENK